MNRSFGLLLGLLVVGAACSDDGGETTPVDPVERCLSLHVPATCLGDTCEPRACRGDEVCDQGGCVPWSEGPLSADFTLAIDPDDDHRVRVQVMEEGFPRAFAEAIRFSFGDGIVGYGEALTHEYSEPGVYPVELEVRLQGLQVLRASRLAVIREDGFPPESVATLTVNEIPAALNGSMPYSNGAQDIPFSLLLPTHGFSVDLALLPAPGASLDPAGLVLTVDAGLADGTPPGTNLADRVVWSDLEPDRAPRGQWLVSAEERLPEGPVTFRMEITDGSGAQHEQALDLELLELGPERVPLDEPLVWLLRFDLDHYTTTPSETGFGTVTFDSRQEPDGEADFLTEMKAIGAGDEPVYLEWIQRSIAREASRFFGVTEGGEARDGIDLRIVIEGDPGAPDPVRFARGGSFSMMRLGGAFDGFLGFSRFAPYANRRIDDSGPDLGVGTAGILSPLLAVPIVADEFDAISPVDGAPAGSHEHDAAVLSPDFDRWDPDGDPAVNARFDDLVRIARFLGLAIGAVTAHEMGHAMGLVPDGAPPDGFFGGLPDTSVTGPRTNSHHADYAGLNLMQAGGDIVDTLTTALNTIEREPDATLVDLALLLALENRLSSYSRAYLQGRLTYANFDGKPAPSVVVGCPH